MEHFIFDRIKIFVPLYDSKTFNFLVYITVQRLIFWNKFRRKKYWKIRYRSKNLHKPSVQLYSWSITRTLNHILRLLHFPSVQFCIWSFLLASTLKQTSEDCIGMECNRIFFHRSWCYILKFEIINTIQSIRGKESLYKLYNFYSRILLDFLLRSCERDFCEVNKTKNRNSTAKSKTP